MNTKPTKETLTVHEGTETSANLTVGDNEQGSEPCCGSECSRRARCGKTARRDLCGGCRVTGSPTALNFFDPNDRNAASRPICWTAWFRSSEILFQLKPVEFSLPLSSCSNSFISVSALGQSVVFYLRHQTKAPSCDSQKSRYYFAFQSEFPSCVDRANSLPSPYKPFEARMSAVTVPSSSMRLMIISIVPVVEPSVAAPL